MGYALAFLGMMIEGDLVLFTSGFLTHRGFFDPGVMFVILNVGVFSGDLLWYELGRRLRHNVWFIAWAERVARPFDDHLKHRTLRTIFFSKFAYGVHHAILVRAGTLHLKLTKFIEDDFVSNLAWIIIVGGMGYFSSASFNSLAHTNHSFHYLQLSFLAALVIFFIIWHYISAGSKRKL